MRTFSDYGTALKVRDIVRAMVQEEIEKLRPKPEYALVVAIDRDNRKCTVQFPGETGTAIVGMGSIQPDFEGQIVRVNGVVGDRYVDDVMGGSFVYVPSYGKATYGSNTYGT